MNMEELMVTLAKRRPLSRRRRHAVFLVACVIALVAALGPLGASPARANSPVLTLTPERDPCDSQDRRATLRGLNFPPGLTVTLTAVRTAPFRSNNLNPLPDATVAADGTFAVEFELRRLSCGYEPQQPEGTRYEIDAEINRTIVATATFTVSGGGRSCFAETGSCAQGRLLEYWRMHGGLAVNGYPISDEFDEQLEDGNTYRVQYFERARFELHPENASPYDVLLGQFGRRILAGVSGAPSAPVPAEAGYTYFPETGHNVGPRFTAYWRSNGGLAQFGYPLTELFTERLEDGNTYRVQYFERARFELHPENAAPHDVLLGQFGRRILAARGPRAITLDPVSGPCQGADQQQVTVRGSGFTPGVSVSCSLRRDRDSASTAGNSASGGPSAAANGTFVRALPHVGCGPDEPVRSTLTIIMAEYTPDRTPAVGPSASATVTGVRAAATTGATFSTAH